MKIRLLKKKDIKRCGEIVRRNYDRHDEKGVIMEMNAMFVKGPFQPVYFVMEESKKVIAFAGYNQSWVDYGIFHIFWVNVDSKEQGKGYGKKIISKIIAEIKKRKDSRVILISATSPKYYEKHFGFKTIEKFKAKRAKKAKFHHIMSLSL